MLGFLTKKEKAQMFSIQQTVFTDRGILDIDKVKKGYRIVGANNAINCVEKVEKSIQKGYFYVVNKKLVLFENQSIIANENVTHAKLLKRNDELTLKNGSKEKIATIKKIKGNYYFHKMTIGGDHTYYINGILVHNASRFWVGGTGTWNSSTAHWSASSGGSSGASVPTSADNVFLDGNSTGTITMDLNAANIKSADLNFTGFTGTFAGAGGTQSWNIYGNLTLGASGTYTATAFCNLVGTSGTLTITTNGVTIPWYISIFSGGATYQLGDNCTVSSTRVFDLGGTGGFNLNGYNLSCGRMVDDNVTGAFAFTLGASTITITNSGLGGFRINLPNTTVSAGTSTIKFTDTSNTGVDLTIGGKTFYNIYFSRGASTGDITVNSNGSGNITVNDFKDDGNAAHRIVWLHGQTYTFSTFTVSGTSGNLITLTSDTTATYAFSKASGTVSCDYLAIAHCVAGGGASWYAGTHSTNNQATATAGSGWIFTAPSTAWTQECDETLHTTDTFAKIRTAFGNFTETITDTDTLIKIANRLFSEVLSMIDNTLGSELAVNGSFSADTNWTKDTGWTISGGSANVLSVAGAGIYQNIGTVGHYYEITYTLSGYVAGALAIMAGTALGANRTANGTYTERITAVGNGNMGVQTVGVTTCSIDNISIKEVTFVGFLGLIIKPMTLTETLSMVDVIARVMNFVYTEVLSMVDTVIRFGQRILSEATSLADTFAGVKFISSIFNEIISFTDFLGRLEQRLLTEATSLTATFFGVRAKFFSETLSMVDTIGRTITHVMNEVLSMVDTITYIFAGVLSEVITTTATALKIGGKFLLETITDTDTMAKLLNHTLSEIFSNTDQLIVTLNGIITNLWAKVARTLDTWNKKDHD